MIIKAMVKVMFKWPIISHIIFNGHLMSTLLDITAFIWLKENLYLGGQYILFFDK